MTVQRAAFETRSAPLTSDFAREFMAKRWGAGLAEAILAAMPTYKQGPRKGERKGFLVWTKCTVGGWHRSGHGGGGVMTPGSYELRIGFSNLTTTEGGWGAGGLASRGDTESEVAYIARLVDAFTAWVGPAHEAHKRAQAASFSPGRRFG